MRLFLTGNPGVGKTTVIRVIVERLEAVESLRLLRAYMTAFGCTPEEIYTMCTVNPSFIVGLDLTATQPASAT